MKTRTTTTILIAFLMLASTGLMGGCVLEGVKGDGNVVKQDRSVSGFTSLDVSGAFTVYLYQGKTESLTIEADENLIDFIKTEVKGDRLEIYIDKENIKKFTKMNVYLTFEELEMIDISGAVSILGEGEMKFDELYIDGSGATDIKLNIDAALLKADFSGASEIELIGSAKSASFDISGASEIDAYDFVVEHCELDVSGAAEVRVNVTGSLEVDASGAASVKYKGNPRVQSDVSGAGSIRSY